MPYSDFAVVENYPRRRCYRSDPDGFYDEGALSSMIFLVLPVQTPMRTDLNSDGTDNLCRKSARG